MGLVAADALEGERIVDRHGEPLGTVEDIIVDVDRGVMAYAVLSRVGSGPLRAIPWHALALDPERHCLVADAAALAPYGPPLST